MVPEEVYWYALQEKRWMIPANIIERVYSKKCSLESLWSADPLHLSQLGLDQYQINNFMSYRKRVNLKDIEKKVGYIHNNKFKIIKYVDREYPQRLKELVNTKEGSPLILFHKGSAINFKKTVAIVGTRECSHHGHMMARRLARVISRKGYTIVSGLARGIDTEAHCGALEVPKGKTIAVLAWVAPLYPPENSQLAKDIQRRGAIIAENYYRIPSRSSKLARGKFVDRNRITSGVSRCLIAVESSSEGGTVHQVRLAQSQGRKVFVVKPKSYSIKAKDGFKLFMKMGATPISSAQPVLNYLKDSNNYKLERERILEEYTNSC